MKKKFKFLTNKLYKDVISELIKTRLDVRVSSKNITSCFAAVFLSNENVKKMGELNKKDILDALNLKSNTVSYIIKILHDKPTKRNKNYKRKNNFLN